MSFCNGHIRVAASLLFTLRLTRFFERLPCVCHLTMSTLKESGFLLHRSYKFLHLQNRKPAPCQVRESAHRFDNSYSYGAHRLRAARVDLLRMKIAVLGATGQTGQYLVQQALQLGHSVTAVVRNPAKLTVQHDNLKVVEANIFSADSLKDHFEGQDAVMSCLGFSPSFLSAVTGYSLSMNSVVTAMREAKVNRLITMTSWYTEPNSGSQAPFMIRFLLLPMIRSVLANMWQMEQFLQKTNDINWTVVRPPGLKNLPASTQEFLTHEGYFVPAISGTPVARGDVARYMLSLLNNDVWIKKGVAITTK